MALFHSPVKASDNPSRPSSASDILLGLTHTHRYFLPVALYYFSPFCCLIKLLFNFMSSGSDQMAEIWSL